MTKTPTEPVTDSPWFWLLLFASMALAMLAAVEPKFTKRYQRIERMHQARNQAALRSAASGELTGGGQAGDEPAEAATHNSRRGGLRPLMFFLAGLMFLAVLAMPLLRLRGEVVRRTEVSP